MADEKEQVAAEPEVVQESEVDDLDTLLAQYEPEQPKAEPIVSDVVKPNTEVADLQARLDRQDTDKEIDIIAGEAGVARDKIEPYLMGKVAGDPKLRGAWEDRFNQPKVWSEVRNSLVKDVSGSFVAVDKAATDDHDLIASAVRGASSTKPVVGNPVVSKMSPSEWSKHQRENGVKPYGTR